MLRQSLDIPNSLLLMQQNLGARVGIGQGTLGEPAAGCHFPS